MTLDGTNTWILAAPGGQDAFVLDPGPDDESHLATVVDHLHGRGLRPAGVLLTHGHIDHSEGARSLADALGCSVRALDEQHGDERLAAGDVLAVDGLECRVVGTPGHTSDSVSLLLTSAEGSALLTGDTVLGRGTTVVAHPDGRLADYLASLRQLRELAGVTGASWVLPGHGPALTDPVGVIDYYLAHRAQRLDQVAAAVESIRAEGAEGVEGVEVAGGIDVAQRVVEIVYADVPGAVWPAALLSVRAQMEFLREEGLA